MNTVDVLRRPVYHVFYKQPALAILADVTLIGCAGSTTVQRQHHLLRGISSTVDVYFLRPSQGYMGVGGKADHNTARGRRTPELICGTLYVVEAQTGKI
jgi:hypothetical protein